MTARSSPRARRDPMVASLSKRASRECRSGACRGAGEVACRIPRPSIVFADTRIGRQAAQARRGAADRGQRGEAAGAIARFAISFSKIQCARGHDCYRPILPAFAIIVPEGCLSGSKAMEWLKRKTSIAGYEISNWIIVLGAIIIVLLIFQNLH
jgi:hypothetical protein